MTTALKHRRTPSLKQTAANKTAKAVEKFVNFDGDFAIDNAFDDEYDANITGNNMSNMTNEKYAQLKQIGKNQNKKFDEKYAKKIQDFQSKYEIIYQTKEQVSKNSIYLESFHYCLQNKHKTIHERYGWQPSMQQRIAADRRAEYIAYVMVKQQPKNEENNGNKQETQDTNNNNNENTKDSNANTETRNNSESNENASTKIESNMKDNNNSINTNATTTTTIHNHNNNQNQNIIKDENTKIVNNKQPTKNQDNTENTNDHESKTDELKIQANQENTENKKEQNINHIKEKEYLEMAAILTLVRLSEKNLDAINEEYKKQFKSNINNLEDALFNNHNNNDDNDIKHMTKNFKHHFEVAAIVLPKYQRQHIGTELMRQSWNKFGSQYTRWYGLVNSNKSKDFNQAMFKWFPWMNYHNAYVYNSILN